MVGRVIERVWDREGLLLGKPNSIPILDTCQYKVKLPNGSIDTYTANDKLAVQINLEGSTLLNGIVIHWFLDHKDNLTYLDKHGKEQSKKQMIVSVAYLRLL